MEKKSTNQKPYCAPAMEVAQVRLEQVIAASVTTETPKQQWETNEQTGTFEW